jgi:hypothetical protein
LGESVSGVCGGFGLSDGRCEFSSSEEEDEAVATVDARCRDSSMVGRTFFESWDALADDLMSFDFVWTVFVSEGLSDLLKI